MMCIQLDGDHADFVFCVMNVFQIKRLMYFIIFNFQYIVSESFWTYYISSLFNIQFTKAHISLNGSI